MWRSAVEKIRGGGAAWRSKKLWKFLRGKGLQVLVPKIVRGRVLVLIARSPRFDVYQPCGRNVAVAGFIWRKFWMELDSESECGYWSEGRVRPGPVESGRGLVRELGVAARSSWGPPGEAPGLFAELGLHCGSAWMAGLSLSLSHIRAS